MGHTFPTDEASSTPKLPNIICTRCVLHVLICKLPLALPPPLFTKSRLLGAASSSSSVLYCTSREEGCHQPATSRSTRPFVARSRKADGSAAERHRSSRHQAQAKISLCSRACDLQQAALLVVVGDTESQVYRYVDYARMYS